jgi:hypothetical protein
MKLSLHTARLAKWGQDKVMPDNEDFTRSLDELIEGRFIIGSPEDCGEVCTRGSSG